jgi:hypothetical protein
LYLTIIFKNHPHSLFKLKSAAVYLSLNQLDFNTSKSLKRGFVLITAALPCAHLAIF